MPLMLLTIQHEVADCEDLREHHAAAQSARSKVCMEWGILSVHIFERTVLRHWVGCMGLYTVRPFMLTLLR